LTLSGTSGRTLARNVSGFAAVINAPSPLTPTATQTFLFYALRHVGLPRASGNGRMRQSSINVAPHADGLEPRQ
jgi:hypothetical protein